MVETVGKLKYVTLNELPPTELVYKCVAPCEYKHTDWYELPTESTASFVFLTLSVRLDISAITPALSVTGPYASKATTIPVCANISVTALTIQYRPAKIFVQKKM